MRSLFGEVKLGFLEMFSQGLDASLMHCYLLLPDLVML